MKHEIVEKKIAVMGALIAVVISVGGLVEIAPLYMQSSVIEPSPGIKPYSALALEGRDVYVREGCYNCHSQMVRPLPAETERYGHYSIAGEAVYDHPFQFGSKRTGPDLARVGGRYTDEWHRIHLLNPRDVVPESNMPGFPWLAERTLDPAGTQAKMQALQKIGVPYTAQEITEASAAVSGRTEMEALIAYMQGLKFYGAPASESSSAKGQK
ncbi:cytochrome-c oxidase, cbb3-type subunit II [Steroidobacter sp.]|uniref:cytochrome-c oxidase, cbb3-type subunit II n=1 Tax=Steroidobacter sp. TaxID=1978227 RepID=UPI001A5DEC85|nr:cytochrome-c oxidase, cbb3-type subunit II [Steroidobacter sp.]MBL8265164.1 cytochrome-c oxidase, cbb3-type subunit II [Steroidobacter sp.]